MRINSISFQPYIYNANYLNSASMNKVSAISDDLLSSKTDFSGLTSDGLNENPLKKGETVNFQSVLQRQFETGQQNAARLIRPAQTESSAEPQAAAENQADSQNNVTPLNPNLMQRAIEAYQANMIA